MIALFVEYPALALLPALVFFALYGQARRRALLIAGATWLLYALYEYGMKRRVLCSGECNIRVDLLLLYPALLVMSLVALIAYLRWRRQR
ncbi:MAG TPA: hypothetical protein VJ596_08325 [Gemmatimonadaceae bacterium]|nr:hypothetical protein [Gemmatimonadaceae bacterium]